MTSVMSRLRPDETTTRSRHADGVAPEIALLPIGADLLPRQAAAGGRGRGTRFAAVGVVLIAVLATAALYLFSSYGRSVSEDRLATAQTQLQSLQTQQRAYASLVSTRQQATALGAAISSVMATDAPWSTLLAEVGKVRGGVTFTAVNASLADSTAATAGTGTTGTGAGTATPGATGVIGSLSITGTAADKPTVAAFVDALSGLTGLSDPFLSTVSAQQGSGTAAGGYSFTVTVDLTADLQTSAKSRWATTTGGGK